MEYLKMILEWFLDDQRLLLRGRLSFIILDGMTKEFLLLEGHLTSPFSCPLMLIPNQMKDSMDHQKGNHSYLIKTKPI